MNLPTTKGIAKKLVEICDILMINNNDKQKSKIKSIKLNRKDKLIFGLLLISVLIIYLLAIVLYFIPNFSVLYNLYSTFYFNILFTVITVLRVTLSIYGSYFLFKIWFMKKTRSYSDLPLLYGLFFFIFIPAKLLDLMIMLNYRLYADFGYSYTFLLNTIKLRYILLIVNVVPLFLSGIYLYMFRLNLKKLDFEREKVSKRLTIIFSSLYFPTFFVVIIILNNIYLFSYIGAIITFSSLIFVIWMFITVYRGKILPEINSLILSIGFICYLIFNVLLPVYVNVIGQFSLEGERLAGLILELGTLFSMIIVLLGFKKKANYKK